MKIPLSGVFFLIGLIHSHGQNFVKVIPQNPIGLYQSESQWIDFDNDGDLDFFTTGQVSTNDLRSIIYENSSNDVFNPLSVNLPVQYGEAAAIPFNLNGDNSIDLIIMGRRIGTELTNRMSLLENLSTKFVDVGPLEGFKSSDGNGTLSRGDVNNDGQEDIFVSGITGYSSGNIDVNAFVFLNNKGTYTKVLPSVFTPLYVAASKLIDLDNDLDLDLIVSGAQVNQNRITEIYLNDGKGNFSKGSFNLEGMDAPSIDLADYDHDHDLDILILGRTSFVSELFLYRNDNGIYQKRVLTGLGRTPKATARWGDYDNDGDVDILLSGQIEGDTKSLSIVENKGNDVFEEIAETSFETSAYGSPVWGDYDNDGDLDILVSGSVETLDNFGLRNELYIMKNQAARKNQAPSKPGNLKSNRSGDVYNLVWSASSDDLTPAQSLTYNISVKETFTENYLLYSFADILSGKRRIVEAGNVGLNTEWKIANLPNGTYELKVQAIDQGFKGSEWSDQINLFVGLPQKPENLTSSLVDSEMMLNWDDKSVSEEFFVVEMAIGDSPFVKIDSVASNIHSYKKPNVGDGMFKFRVYAKNSNGSSDYSNESQVVILGLNDVERRHFTLFPNPVVSRLTIKTERIDNFDNVHFQIISGTGAIVVGAQIMDIMNGQFSVAVDSIPTGIYILQLSGPNFKSERFKFVKL